MYNPFSDSKIHETYIHLNSLDYLHSGEEGLDEEDFEEDDEQYPNSYRTENRFNQFNCMNDEQQ